MSEIKIIGLDAATGKRRLGEVGDITIPAGGGSPTWGSITGTLAAQTDLQGALDAKLDDSQLDGLAKITVGITQPSTPSVGDLWIDIN
jgi:hypothetical protein